MKTCSRCKRDLPRSEFHKAGHTPDGLQYGCKACRREQNRGRMFTQYGHGLTLEQADELIERQGGVCATCGSPPSGQGRNNQRLHIDHDHATGRIRGALCSNCNRALGFVKDSPDILARMIEYLR